MHGLMQIYTNTHRAWCKHRTRVKHVPTPCPSAPQPRLLSPQAAVPESARAARRARADDAFGRGPPVPGHSALHERVLLLPRGTGLRPDGDLWSRNHH